jgi:hypothetical protein
VAPPARLAPLLDQFDFACQRLLDRMTGPEVDSGTGVPIATGPMTDEEYLWEPVPGCWNIRRQADGPGPQATFLAGAGEWGRDSSTFPHPWPPPFTTMAWRLGHLSEMLSLRADHMDGTHSITRDEYIFHGEAAAGVDAFRTGVEAWRKILAAAHENDLDAVGRSTYPYGSDPEDPLIETVWWVNQELLHHGAEIALLRDLYRDWRT